MTSPQNLRMLADEASGQTEARLAELEAAARYERERRDLYRARAYSSRPVSAARLRELERSCRLAEDRLQRARLGS